MKFSSKSAMRLLPASIGFFCISGLGSLCIVRLISGQEIVEDIGSAWKTMFILANVFYAPAIAIFLAILIQNRVGNGKIIFGGFAYLLGCHLIGYAGYFRIWFILWSQILFVAGLFCFMKIFESKSVKKSLGMD